MGSASDQSWKYFCAHRIRSAQPSAMENDSVVSQSQIIAVSIKQLLKLDNRYRSR